MSLRPGTVCTDVLIGPIAHGGHFVARVDGQVVFVRGALTGELVDLRITTAGKRFARGEVIAVHQPSPHRVAAPCPVAERCGGCDFQHVEPRFTRELKRQVIAEQLAHLGGYTFGGIVEEVAPSPWGGRTRMRYLLDDQGRAGLRGHRSQTFVAVPTQGCLLADPQISAPEPIAPGAAELIAVRAADQTLIGPPQVLANTEVRESVLGEDFQVAADGFWQAHGAAAATLVTAVLDGLAPQPGEVAADLFCGSGLFARFLASAGCQVMGIEGDRTAVSLARRNVPEAEFLVGDVESRMGRLPSALDIVVLDPPRAGAGADVLARLLERRPRAVAYVACDPASLGRDVGYARAAGYVVTSLRAFDVFPMTHHVECVAILQPAD